MDVFHTILRPMITEKSSHQSKRTIAGAGGTYTFEVHAKANKAQIRDAVEKVYGVKVRSVRTSIVPGKPRRTRLGYVKTSETKKAVVVLHPDQHIDLF